MKVGFLHSLIRKDEKFLIEEFNKRKGVELVMIDDRNLSFNIGKDKFDLDVVIERCINHSRALHSIVLYESAGIKCVNNSSVATICGDKLLTSVELGKQKIPQPEVRVAFTEESALQTIEEMGYPVVLKPAVGSWGRLLSKINDRDAAESILEHKTFKNMWKKKEEI
jgi:[lysine-biosynthesis-protein LysW]--L-2-aminoadipate ligase